MSLQRASPTRIPSRRHGIRRHNVWSLYECAPATQDCVVFLSLGSTSRAGAGSHILSSKHAVESIGNSFHEIVGPSRPCAIPEWDACGRNCRQRLYAIRESLPRQVPWELVKVGPVLFLQFFDAINQLLLLVACQRPLV